MVEEFREYITSNKLFDESDKILLAVSGGIDSMVMAHLFLSTRFNIGIAHCNFQLRGKESDDDEIFVKELSDRNKIPFHTQRFDTSGFAEEKGISIQMAARELRYRWFEEIRSQYDYSLISIAHNLNDNIETFLINLTRGTGIAGLTGMKPKHNNIIRPLLFATRNAINEYCTANNVGFREDRSNAETKYTRNKIRHIIIPQFKTINPSFEATISETSERLNEINEILNAYLAEIKKRVTIQRGNEIVFKISLLESLYPINTILWELFRPYGLGKDQLEDLRKLFKSRSGSQLFTISHRVIKNRRELIVIKNEEKKGDFFILSDIKDLRHFPGCISASVKKCGAGLKIPSSQNIAYLDADKITYPVVIRRWKHGDVFYPLGMRQKKKLSDYFTDKRYSLHDKENCLILESAGNIVWIINERIDNRYKISPETKKALIIKMKN